MKFIRKNGRIIPIRDDKHGSPKDPSKMTDQEYKKFRKENERRVKISDANSKSTLSQKFMAAGLITAGYAASIGAGIVLGKGLVKLKNKLRTGI